MSTLFAPIDPSQSTSVSTLRVRFHETDLMGIVHHAAYFPYFEIGRVDWFRKRGLTYADWTKRRLQMPVLEARARYRAPCRFDDVLSIETTLTELRAASLEYTYRILRDTTLVADGSTRLACIDDDHHVLRIPDAIREVLLAGECAS